MRFFKSPIHTHDIVSSVRGLVSEYFISVHGVLGLPMVFEQCLKGTCHIRANFTYILSEHPVNSSLRMLIGTCIGMFQYQIQLYKETIILVSKDIDQNH